LGFQKASVLPCPSSRPAHGRALAPASRTWHARGVRRRASRRAVGLCCPRRRQTRRAARGVWRGGCGCGCGCAPTFPGRPRVWERRLSGLAWGSAAACIRRSVRVARAQHHLSTGAAPCAALRDATTAWRPAPTSERALPAHGRIGEDSGSIDALIWQRRRAGCLVCASPPLLASRHLRRGPTSAMGVGCTAVGCTLSHVQLTGKQEAKVRGCPLPRVCCGAFN